MTKASVSTFFFDSGINLSSKKCVLFRIRVKYIRHVVSACDIDPDHDMIWKVREWLTLSFFSIFSKCVATHHKELFYLIQSEISTDYNKIFSLCQEVARYKTIWQLHVKVYHIT